MAKGKLSTDGSKETFGKRREGVSKKKYGPKEQKPKNYKGQGR